MWPILYENVEHNIRVGTYGVLLILAFSLAFLFVNGRARNHGLNPDHLIYAYVAAAFGGIAGARLFTAFTFELKQTLADPSSLLTLNGLTYYGGVMGGVFAVLIVAKLQGFLGWKFLDLAAPALVIGHTMGRLGCFFGGCCHGAPVELSNNAYPLGAYHNLKGEIWLDIEPPFLATEFFSGLGRFNSTPLYPTQLWSAICGLVLIFVLIRALDRKSFDGQIVALMFIFEPMVRFFIELFRADERGVVLEIPVARQLTDWFPGLVYASTSGNIGLTTSQITGILLMAVGVTIWFLQRGKGVRWR